MVCFDQHWLALFQIAFPTSYRVKLDVGIPANDAFSGSVVIRFVALRQVQYLTLHVDRKGITTIDKRSVVLELEGNGRTVSELEWNDELETLTLRLSESIKAGSTYTLTIKYEGKLRTDMYGFYKSTYEMNTQEGSKQEV